MKILKRVIKKIARITLRPFLTRIRRFFFDDVHFQFDKINNKIDSIGSKIESLERNIAKIKENQFNLYQIGDEEFNSRQRVVESNIGLMILPTHSDNTISPTIISTGEWEPLESMLVRNLLREGDFVIDIGANFGWYSLLMAEIVGDNGIVIALEPEQENFEILRKNVLLQKKPHIIKTLNMAAHSSDDESVLIKSPENKGDHRVFMGDNDADEDVYDEGNWDTQKIKTIKLDSLIKQLPKRLYRDLNYELKNPIRLIKMDTQGAEYHIFKGAEKTLELTEYVITELWPYGLRRQKTDPKKFINKIAEHFDSFQIISGEDADLDTTYPIMEAENLAEQLKGIFHTDLFLFNK